MDSLKNLALRLDNDIKALKLSNRNSLAMTTENSNRISQVARLIELLKKKFKINKKC